MRTLIMTTVSLILYAPCTIFSSELDDLVLSASNILVCHLHPLFERQITPLLSDAESKALEQQIGERKAQYHQLKVRMDALLTNDSNAAALLAHVHGMLLHTNPAVRVRDCAFSLLDKVSYTHPYMTAIVLTDTLRSSSCPVVAQGSLLSVLWNTCNVRSITTEVRTIASPALLHYAQHGDKVWREYAVVALLGRNTKAGVDPDKGKQLIEAWLASEEDWNMRLHYYDMLHRANIWNANMQADINQMILDVTYPVCERSSAATELMKQGMLDSNTYTKLMCEYAAWTEQQRRSQDQTPSTTPECTNEYMKAIH